MLILSGFFVLATTVYVVWTLAYGSQRAATYPTTIQDPPIEWAGTVALGLSAVLSGLIGFYLTRVSRSVGRLPEDRNDAEIDDGEAEQGMFSPHSWWPVLLAGALALVFIGLAAGIWLSFLGAPIALLAIIGWIYEYYRGYFSH
jgi:hypothetical protein